MAAELNFRIKEFESDPEVDVGVLYGVGGSFSSGYDLAEIQQKGFQGHLKSEVIKFDFISFLFPFNAIKSSFSSPHVD